MTNPVLALACELIERVSVTPEDAGCQEIIGNRLSALGFTLRQLNAHGVHNLYASRGTGSPHLMFAGHTDVVPAGPLEDWQSAPFKPTLRNREGGEHLFGRGAADMKSSLAAMLVATETFMRDHADFAGTLSYLITSDEEGEATYGTRHAIDVLRAEGIQPDYCVVGEPSSSSHLGDVVRCGRRGSLNGTLTVAGKQGHVAYPDLARNPIHDALAALDELATTKWDDGNEFYPPTSFQISNIESGTGATNVIPGSLKALFNLRFNTEQTAAALQTQIESVCAARGLNSRIDWHLSGEPFLTQPGALTAAVTTAISQVTARQPEYSTSGGTSDGRFISPWGIPQSAQVEVVELGPINATIHQVNECVAVADLLPLSKIYCRILSGLLVE